jgi:hypothetical protein
VARGGVVNVDNNHLAESMQWQLVATLVCCLLLRFEEVGGEEVTDNALLGKEILDSVLVEIQFNTFLFMLYRLLKATVFKRWGWSGGDGRGVVVPVVSGDEREEDDDDRGDDEAEVFLLRSQLNERDSMLRERESALRERDASLREKDAAYRESEKMVRERDEVIRVLKGGGLKDL